jgi:hypothetical protein
MSIFTRHPDPSQKRHEGAPKIGACTFQDDAWAARLIFDFM